MTILILAGYAICIISIFFTSKSKCKETTLGKVILANTVVFLVIASLILVFVHIIIWLPICCGNKSQAMEKVSPSNDSQQPLKNNTT
jgi:hypothetical protein